MMLYPKNNMTYFEADEAVIVTSRSVTLLIARRRCYQNKCTMLRVDG